MNEQKNDEQESLLDKFMRLQLEYQKTNEYLDSQARITNRQLADKDAEIERLKKLVEQAIPFMEMLSRQTHIEGNVSATEQWLKEAGEVLK